MIVRVQALRAEGACEALSANDILFVFTAPAGSTIRLGHEVELDPLVRDKPQKARDVSTGVEFTLVLKDNNIHDIRLPSGHGTCRTPSEARLWAA